MVDDHIRTKHFEEHIIPFESDMQVLQEKVQKAGKNSRVYIELYLNYA